MLWTTKLSKTRDFIDDASRGWQVAISRDRHFLTANLPPPATLSGGKYPSEFQNFRGNLGVLEQRNQRTPLDFETVTRADIGVIGAGPLGLAAAIYLSMNNPSLKVAIFEQRSTADGKAIKPYTREWITNLPLRLVAKLLTAEDLSLITDIAKTNYFGCSIRHLEFALMRKARQQGIIVARSEGLDQIDGINLWVDASGGKLPWQGKAKVNDKLPFPVMSYPNANAIDIFGQRILAPEPGDKQHLQFFGDFWRPTLNAQRIDVPLIKITKIHPSLKERFFDRFILNDYCPGLYFWEGTMKADLNESLLIMSLSPSEFSFMAHHVSEVQSLSTLLERHDDSVEFGDRPKAVIRWLSDNKTAFTPCIEPPFQWSPYIKLQRQSLLYGRPMIHVGDSLFNGNPKAGNGLGAHLRDLRRAFGHEG